MPVALATLLLGVASAMPTTLQLFPATHPQIRVVGRTAQAPHPSRRPRGRGAAGDLLLLMLPNLCRFESVAGI
eukprot:COSAG04_NODE_479_length_13687_cov_2.863262_10_plen_73_part_00